MSEYGGHSFRVVCRISSPVVKKSRETKGPVWHSECFGSDGDYPILAVRPRLALPPYLPMYSQLKRVIALTFALGALAGCSVDTSTSNATPLAPTAVASPDLIGTLASSVTYVTGLQRTAPLPAAITVTQTIGSDGGVLAIPSAGVLVTIPSGALVAPTVVSMTARAGSLVAYDFAPHGITFAKPIDFTQSLAGTNATPLKTLTMKLGYYLDASALTPVGAMVSELIKGTVNLLTWTFHAKISHFSGYIISC